MNKVIQIKPWALCSGCNISLEIETNYYFEYFDKKTSFCKNCKKFDLYSFLKKTIDQNIMKNVIYSLLGAQSIRFQIILTPKKKISINFEKKGVPENSKILSVIYSPYSDGNLFPVEMHSNQTLRRKIQKNITIYPAELSENVSETKVYVLLYWIDNSLSNDGYLYDSFLDSFFYYVDKNYEKCIVPANIAVESKLNSLITKYNKKKLKSNNISYNIQLNNLLPLIIKNHNLIELPKNIIDKLNVLRKKRNEIAHNGKTVATNREDIVEYLSSSIFFFEYIKYIERKLNFIALT